MMVDLGFFLLFGLGWCIHLVEVAQWKSKGSRKALGRLVRVQPSSHFMAMVV